jgi:hypothetical protein
MALPRRARTTAVVVAAAGTLLAGSITFATSGHAATTAAAGCGVFYDDFAYSSRTDPAFTGNGWSARSNAGGPGVAGATWNPDNISFPTVDGQKVAQLTASTDGSSSGTQQAEFLQTRQRFLNGTYASRIKFQDTPAGGTDGDHINETYFTIGPAQRYDYDPLYSELDFSEYLPNGGWGVSGPIDYETSWNGYREDPWDPHNAHSSQNRSLDGWHTIVTQVGGGHVKYYIDGALVGDHTTDDATGTYPVYPRASMSLNYNLWFIDLAAHTSGTSTYTEAVDWTYYAKDQTLSPADATAQAGAIRGGGETHRDTLDSTGGCGPTTPPTGTPTGSPTTPPAPACSAPAWNSQTIYHNGDTVTYAGHTYTAKWWSQADVPSVHTGDGQVWRDNGPC